MALTTAQLTDMQGDLGINNDQSVFTDTELNRFYTRAAEDYNTSVWLAYRQLYGASAKYFDYKVAQTEEKRSQLRTALKEMVDFWDGIIHKGQQVAVVGITSIPPAWKDEPSTAYPCRPRRRVIR